MQKETEKNIARVLLAANLVLAGIGHLSFARKGFQAQVPDWVPLKKDDTVVYSGIVEIALGAALLLAPKRIRKELGRTAAAFFVAVFPGNMSQYSHHRDGLGLDTDRKRFGRLFLQPLLILGALWSTSPERTAA